MHENRLIRCVYESVALAALLYAAVVLVAYPVLAQTWRDGLDPAFVSIARSSLSGLTAHGDPLGDADGAGDFRAAADALCVDSVGGPPRPIPAQTLAAYPGGYDRYGVNPPPPGVRETTLAVPLRWTDYAVVPCFQKGRTSYLLLHRSLVPQPFGSPSTQVGVAEGAGRWTLLENASFPQAALDRRGVLAEMEDLVRRDRDDAVQPDRSVVGRLPDAPAAGR